MSNIYVPGKGAYNPKIAFVGEAPSYDEEQSLTPFTGPSGRFLDQILRDVGINRSECFLTNVCKYMITPNSKGGKAIPFSVRAERDGINLAEQINELRLELDKVNPSVIVPLGSTALWAITGKKSIKSFRGSILSGMSGRKTIATYHPAHILYSEGEVKGYWNKQVMAFDLKRAKAQSEFREIKLPHRTLQVCKSSHQFADFIHRYRTFKHPAIDIEANKCIPVCVGISFAPHEGITIPLWEHLTDMPRAEIVTCWKLLAEFLANHDVVGQNFGYDRDKLKRLGFLVRSLYSDTMYKAFAINPELPKNLAFNTSIYTEEPFYKDEGMYEGSSEDLLIGCARDACVTKEVDLGMQLDIDQLELEEYYRNFLLPLHGLYAFTEESDSIEQCGIAVDEGIREELLRKYIAWDERVRYDLFKLTGEYVNTSSPKQVSELLYNKWKLPVRQGTGEEVLTQLLNNSVKREDHKRGIELILEDRRVKKTIGTYLLTPTDFDGRMRTSFFICLETGRSSTQQQEPPIRPTLEFKDPEDNKKKTRALGMAFQTITKHGDIGQDVRKMLVPDKGCVFIQADLSQAEARVVTLLADDLETLALYDLHDIHAVTASWFFGGVEDDYSKKKLGYESPYRFAGKTLRHAGHLGASKRRASIELNTQARKNKLDFTISEGVAEKSLKIFHAKFPKLKQVFHNGIIKALEKNRRLTAPVPFGIDANKGGTRIFYERWGDELNRQAFSYIPQRSVSEHTKAAGIRIRKSHKWIKIVNEAHDALLSMVPERQAEECAEIMRYEMQRPLDFSNCTLPRGILVIPSDIEFGYNYMELSKFKFKVM